MPFSWTIEDRCSTSLRVKPSERSSSSSSDPSRRWNRSRTGLGRTIRPALSILIVIPSRMPHTILDGKADGRRTQGAMQPICDARSPLTTSRIVKYYRAVHIVTRKHLSEAMQEYPDAANEIKAWVVIVEGVRWNNFADVRLMFRDADYIDGYVVFNIRRNRFRLITVIHYAKTTDEKRTEGHVYIRSFLTHKEYNDRRKWDRRFGAK